MYKLEVLSVGKQTRWEYKYDCVSKSAIITNFHENNILFELLL